MYSLGFLVAVSFLVAGGCCAVWWVMNALMARRPLVMMGTVLSEPRTFVFREGYLISHSGEAGFLLPLPINHLTAWDSLIDTLNDIVKGAAEAMVRLQATGDSFRLKGQLGNDELVLVGLPEGDTLRITLSASDRQQNSVRVDKDTLENMHVEIANLRRACETNPMLSWCLDERGRITWANGTYRAKVCDLHGEDAGRAWPIPAIFSDESSLNVGTFRRKLPGRTYTRHPGPDVGDGPRASRIAATSGNWYELTVTETRGAGRFVHAVPVDKVVQAEESLRNFIQTLTKTFAHLPTGLAIFDRNRRLVLFNPALVDLTGINAALLSQRPTLESFFDLLRDMKRAPEPKDYKTWRDSLTRIDRAGEGGTYKETWTLPDGQTFRVTGRPHSDGAVALLIEDISAEIGLTRRFHSELEIFQSALDVTDEAMIVLSNADRVLVSNAAYAKLWDHDLRCRVADVSALEVIEMWRNKSMANAVWGEIRDFVSLIGERAEWFDDVCLRDGRRLKVRVSPLAIGVTLIGFAENLQEAPRVPSRLTRSEAPAAFS